MISGFVSILTSNRGRVAAIGAAALLAALPWSAASGGDLTGRWTLVEQRYDAGRADVSRPGEQLSLDLLFETGPAGPRGRAVFGGRDAALDWPAAPIDGTPAPITIVSRTIDVEAGRAHAVYRIDPPRGAPGWSLVITEEYALDAGGSLAGTMDVRMESDGKPRGGYVLHRRFERVR